MPKRENNPTQTPHRGGQKKKGTGVVVGQRRSTRSRGTSVEPPSVTPTQPIAEIVINAPTAVRSTTTKDPSYVPAPPRAYFLRGGDNDDITCLTFGLRCIFDSHRHVMCNKCIMHSECAFKKDGTPWHDDGRTKHNVINRGILIT